MFSVNNNFLIARSCDYDTVDCNTSPAGLGSGGADSVCCDCDIEDD